MSLIDTEITKLRARAQQVIQHLRLQLALLEEAVQAQDWEKLRAAETLREQSLEGDMRLDRRCARILALHQPVANDLRLVLAVLRMHFYVDEIGERITTISRRLANFAPQLPEEALQTVPLAKLVQQVRRLLEMCLDAFFRDDTPRSKSIDAEDQAVDSLYETCMQLIVAQLMAPLTATQAQAWTELAITVKTLEKVADYAIDIADAYLYYAEGVYYWHRWARRSGADS